MVISGSILNLALLRHTVCCLNYLLLSCDVLKIVSRDVLKLASPGHISIMLFSVEILYNIIL